MSDGQRHAALRSPRRPLLERFTFLCGPFSTSSACISIDRAGHAPARLALGLPVAVGAALLVISTLGQPTATVTAQEREEAPLQEVIMTPLPLTPTEQLVLVFSKSTDRHGNTRNVLVFLGRPKNKGWEAIGNGDVAELQAHWRRVAERFLRHYRELDLTDYEQQKIDLAVEFTIAQFIRVYQQLQQELERDAVDQEHRAELIGDPRFNQLRNAGTNGLFDRDSLAVRVARTIANRKPVVSVQP